MKRKEGKGFYTEGTEEHRVRREERIENARIECDKDSRLAAREGRIGFDDADD